MTDIVERLSFDAARCEVDYSKGVAGNITEAADEIKRLRVQITEMDLDRTHNARERDRLQEAKRAALKVADERSKENVGLRMAIRAAHYALTKSSLTADERVQDATAALARTFDPTPQAFIEAKAERDAGWPRESE